MRLVINTAVSLALLPGLAHAQHPGACRPGVGDLAVLSEYRMEIVPDTFEVVYDYSADQCTPITLADFSVRAMRTSPIRVHLYIAHSGESCAAGYFPPTTDGSRRLSGPNFQNLKLNCSLPPVLISSKMADPALRRNREWLHGVWTFDGQVVIGFVHNEYHASCHPGNACSLSPTNDLNLCSGNPLTQPFCGHRSITQVVSFDGGANFSSPTSGQNWIAADPEGWPNDMLGMDEPSNPVWNCRDGFFYMMFHYKLRHSVGLPGPYSAPGLAGIVSVMRTKDVTDPSSWRGWGGELADGGSGTFDVQFYDGFIPSPPPGWNPDDHVPWPLKEPSLGLMHHSLLYCHSLECFVVVGRSAAGIGKPTGIFYSFSQNLTDWTPSKMLDPLLLVDGVGYEPTYPSLIDHSSPSWSFDTVGDSGHVYFVDKQDGTGGIPAGLNRDVVRVGVRLSKR